jgi:hypothetical protein
MSFGTRWRRIKSRTSSTYSYELSISSWTKSRKSSKSSRRITNCSTIQPISMKSSVLEKKSTSITSWKEALYLFMSWKHQTSDLPISHMPINPLSYSNSITSSTRPKMALELAPNLIPQRFTNSTLSPAGKTCSFQSAITINSPQTSLLAESIYHSITTKTSPSKTRNCTNLGWIYTNAMATKQEENYMYSFSGYTPKYQTYFHHYSRNFLKEFSTNISLKWWTKRKNFSTIKMIWTASMSHSNNGSRSIKHRKWFRSRNQPRGRPKSATWSL